VVANAVPGFLPSTHGFSFPNAWPPGPTIRLRGLDPRRFGFGDASAGLCGGMVMTVRDLYEAGLSGSGRAQPENGSAAFDAIVRRQVQSLDFFRVPLRYYDLMAFRPDPPAGVARVLRREPPRVDAVEHGWPRIRAGLDAGHPVPLGLIRVASASPWDLPKNHQVLAYAYDLADDGSGFTIRIYDPNHPGRDDVELRGKAAPDDGRPMRDRISLSQSTGETLLGFFAQPYPRPNGVRAWREVERPG
jgi:hypothetical protein